MANDPRQRPWRRAEIEAKVEHGLRDGMAHPREVPETPTRRDGVTAAEGEAAADHPRALQRV
jgi:hypothetical protein